MHPTKLFVAFAFLLAGLVPFGANAQSSSACNAFSYNLYFGLTDAQTNGEVSRLQSQLGGQVTGYFGPLTERLVQAWQASQGIVSSGSPDTTGYGAVGPRTRALLATNCSTASSPFQPLPTPTPNNLTEDGQPFLYAEFVSSDMSVVDVTNGPDYAEYQITLELTANDSDIFVPASKTTEDTTLSSVGVKTGWNFDVTGATAVSGASNIDSTAVFAMSADTAYLIREGDTEEFTFLVTATTSSGGGQLKLGAIQFGTSATDIFSKTLYLDTNEFGTPKPVGGTTGTTSIYSVALKDHNYTKGVLELEGVAENIASFGITLDQGDKVYGSGSNAIKVKNNGTWFHRALVNLVPGTYNFNAFTSNNVLIGFGTLDIEAEKVATCYFRPDTGGGENGISFGNRSQTAQSCLEMCTISRNEKWGMSTSGSCTYTDKNGKTTVTRLSGINEVSGTVTIAKSTHDVARPTLTGTAKNLESFTIVITGTGEKYGDVVFVKNGKWSHRILSDFQNGTYGVEAYDPKGNLLGKGTFRIAVPEEEEEDEEVVQENTWKGVTAVGVYEGSYTASNPRVFQSNVEGYVNVNVTGDVGGENHDLVLTSYEPVNWILNVQDGVKIKKIIVAGYNKSRVTNVPSGTEVEYHSYATNGTYYYAYQSSGDSYTKLYNWLKGMYPGASNDLLGNFVFPGYSASSINVYIGLKG